MNKRKIIVVYTGELELGGVERSLISLLDSIDYNKYDVDLFLYGHHGVLFKKINKNVNLLPEIRELSYLRESFIKKIKNFCFFSAIFRLFYKLNRKDNDLYKMNSKIVNLFTPKIKTHYDIALGFFRPFDVLINKIDADIKVGWVHTDYSNDMTYDKYLYNDYKKLDYIAAVSDSCADSFKKVFPMLATKVITVENIILKSEIIEQANSFNAKKEMPHTGAYKLLSVGRFCVAKNFDSIPEICSLLIKKGLNVIWYIIGFGEMESVIRDKIKEYSMEENVIILGKKENPYPYILECDLYVQPSLFEGKCVVVREAQTLGKPVIITNFPTSRSQLINNYDGMIVPMDNVGCADGIFDFLNDRKKIEKIQTNLNNNDYSNIEHLNRIFELKKEFV